MAEQEIQLDPIIAEADIRAPTELNDPARSFPSLPHLRTRRFAPRDQRTHDDIPEGRLRDATYRRDGIYRRALALADVASAAIAVLIGVPILGQDALNPLALLALPLVLVVGKVTGLYDRDEHLIKKTTLDEVPALFWVATLYALLIWPSMANSAVTRPSGSGRCCSRAWSRFAPSQGTWLGACPARSDAWCWATPTRRTGSRAGSMRCRG